jgi:undecaprenyl-phosphate 4-deoxy-4-formamido-L-arabinose transferase
MVVSILALLFVCYLAYRRLFYGPEVEGVFTLFGIAIFLMGLLLFSVGMLGEYIGRIAGQVRQRKRFRVASVLEADEGVKSHVGGELPPSEPE